MARHPLVWILFGLVGLGMVWAGWAWIQRDIERNAEELVASYAEMDDEEALLDALERGDRMSRGLAGDTAAPRGEFARLREELERRQGRRLRRADEVTPAGRADARGGAAPASDEADTSLTGLMLAMMALVVLVLAAMAAAAWTLLRPSPDAALAEAASKMPVPGQADGQDPSAPRPPGTP